MRRVGKPFSMLMLFFFYVYSLSSLHSCRHYYFVEVCIFKIHIFFVQVWNNATLFVVYGKIAYGEVERRRFELVLSRFETGD